MRLLKPFLYILLIILISLISCSKKQKNREELIKYPSLEKAMSNPDSVTEINISYVNTGISIDSFSKMFLPFKNLKKLNIGGHRLNNGMPPEIHKLNNLEELSLRIVGLQKIPKELGQLIKLKKLKLGGNYLTYLPKELKNLHNLEFLDIGSNKIENINDILCSFKKLKHLNIEHNSLKEFPTCITEMKSLKVLIMQYNALNNIPDDIGKLEELEEIELYKGHSFDNFEFEIAKLKNLKSLKKIYIDWTNENQKMKIIELLPNVEISGHSTE